MSIDVGDGERSRNRGSPVAAALLNLTGLALGYAYLQRWRRAALHAAGSVGLVAVAFATDAASLPWLWRALAVGWLGWMALDGWRLASPGPRVLGARQELVPSVVGVVLLAVVVSGYLLYGVAGRSVYAEGIAAQSRADCATAITKYDTVTGPYELTLSRDVPAAAEQRAQCVAFEAASRAEAGGAYADAVSRYQDYRRTYPATALAPFVHENLQRSYASWAGSLHSARDFPAAIRVYRDLLAESGSGPGAAEVRGELAATYFEQAEAARASLPASSSTQRVELARTAVDALLAIQRELGDTAPAATVPQALTGIYTAANSPFAEQKFCDALGVLDYFVTLSGPETAGVVGTANLDRAKALLECGLANYRAADYTGAITELDKLANAYPDSPLAAQARSVVIAARVAVEKAGGSPPVLPAPLGGNSPGSIVLTFYNDSPLEARVLIAGPTAHEITVPGCPGCPAQYEPGAKVCPTFAGKPSVTLRLQPGTYDMFSFHPSDSTIKKWVSARTITPGYSYTTCLYIERERPLLDPLPHLPTLEPIPPLLTVEPLPVPVPR